MKELASPRLELMREYPISALQFFQDWTQRNSREVIADLRLVLESVRLVPRSMMTLPIAAFRLAGQAQWVRLLAPDTLLLIRGDVQLSDRALVPIEQFSLGGLESVRGYRQDLLLTDNGALLLRRCGPVLRVSQLDGVLQVAPLMSAPPGTARVIQTNTLASVGLGLRWQQGDRLTARLDWAFL